MPSGRKSSPAVTPWSAALGRTCGRRPSGMPKYRHSSASQFAECRSASRVREALVRSVPWTRPPVSRHSRNESMVPHASFPASARRRQLASWSSSQRNFVAGEVRIEDQAGLLVQPALVGLMVAAEVGGAAILPDDGAGQRCAPCRAIPQQARLALVGHADGRQVLALDRRGGQRLGDDLADAAPDLLGVVLHPARPGIMLRQFARRAAARLPGGVVDHGPGAGGALVDRQEKNVLHRKPSDRDAAAPRAKR